jgi:hypothetical protein
MAELPVMKIDIDAVISSSFGKFLRQGVYYEQVMDALLDSIPEEFGSRLYIYTENGAWFVRTLSKDKIKNAERFSEPGEAVRCFIGHLLELAKSKFDILEDV